MMTKKSLNLFIHRHFTLTKIDMLQIIRFCIIAVVAIKIDGLSENQTFALAAYYIKKCISPAIVDYDSKTKHLGNCPTTIKTYLDCLNNTKNNTIYLHTCPYLNFQSGVIPVFCFNGSWGKVDYNSYCEKITEEESEHRKYIIYYDAGIISKWQYDYELNQVLNTQIIADLAFYLRIIDAVVCFVSFVILLLLIPLKNNRVMLHRNLIACIMLRDVAVLVSNSLKDTQMSDSSTYSPRAKACSYVYVVQLYLIFAEIAWMFNEGFFQFRQFFFVFITKSYMVVYFVFGWLMPAFFTFAIYLPLMLNFSPYKNFHHCWSLDASYEMTYVIYGPVYLLIAINLGFLSYLMWIIRTKLKDGVGTELEKSRKAARSFLILIFLLGGGYIFSSYGPDKCTPFRYIQVILIAPQGIYICTVQVFISREVWRSAKLKLNRLKQSSVTNPRAFSQATQSTSISFIKRLSVSIFSRKESDFKFNTSQPMVSRNGSSQPSANKILDTNSYLNEVENSKAPQHHIRRGLSTDLSAYGITNVNFENDMIATNNLHSPEVAIS